jgi:CRP-like cAMP-binding protein
MTAGEVGARDSARSFNCAARFWRAYALFVLNDRGNLRVPQVTDVQKYSDGETVIAEGERGEELYIVLEGLVDVMRGEAKLTNLSPGEHFGEMALIRSQPRSATVKSSGLSELMVIRRPDFFEILRNEHQLAVNLWQLWGFSRIGWWRRAARFRRSRAEMAAEDITEDIFFSEEDEDRQTSKLPPPPSSTRTPSR